MNYMGIKLTTGIPQTLGAYNEFKGWDLPKDEDPNTAGYQVIYPDGYVSWSPKEQFERANMVLSDYNALTQEIVEGFISNIESVQMGEKTTVVKVTLANGFVITESSSCILPEDFDMEIGTDICIKIITDKVWEFLSFTLHTGINGLK